MLLCVIGAIGKKNVFQESPLNQKEKRPNLFHKENKALALTRHSLFFLLLCLGFFCFFFALHLLTYKKYSQFKENLQHFPIELLGKKLKTILKNCFYQ